MQPRMEYFRRALIGGYWQGKVMGEPDRSDISCVVGSGSIFGFLVDFELEAEKKIGKMAVTNDVLTILRLWFGFLHWLFQRLWG